MLLEIAHHASGNCYGSGNRQYRWPGRGWTLDDENKKLVTAITTGDVKGIVAAQMRGQEGKIHEVTSGIWTTLKYAALVVLGIMSIPLFITRSNAKKINKICEETKHAKTD